MRIENDPNLSSGVEGVVTELPIERHFWVRLTHNNGAHTFVTQGRVIYKQHMFSPEWYLYSDVLDCNGGGGLIKFVKKYLQDKGEEIDG